MSQQSATQTEIEPKGLPFSQDETQFRKGLQYSVSLSPDTVMEDMNFFRGFDRQQEKLIHIGTALIVVGVVLTAGGVILFGIENPVLGFISLLFGLVSLVVGGVLKFRFGKLNLDDRRYELVAGLLKLLSKDMAADAPTNVDLDFTPHNHKSKFQRAGKVGYWNAKFYVDPWLSMKGTLLDGTKFTVALLEKQQDRSRTKISASGKRKHKTKTKNASEVIVSLKIKEKRYPNAQDLDKKIQNAVVLPPWTGLKSVGVVDNVLTLRTSTKNPWDAQLPSGKANERDGINWVAMSFLSLYKLLNDAKNE